MLAFGVYLHCSCVSVSTLEGFRSHTGRVGEMMAGTPPCCSCIHRAYSHLNNYVHSLDSLGGCEHQPIPVSQESPRRYIDVSKAAIFGSGMRTPLVERVLRCQHTVLRCPNENTSSPPKKSACNFRDKNVGVTSAKHDEGTMRAGANHIVYIPTCRDPRSRLGAYTVSHRSVHFQEARSGACVRLSQKEQK